MLISSGVPSDTALSLPQHMVSLKPWMDRFLVLQAHEMLVRMERLEMGFNSSKDSGRLAEGIDRQSHSNQEKY